MIWCMRGYPGGKSAPGTFHRIISLMPPHEIYIEPFMGGFSIGRLKRPAKLNIGIDRDRAAVEKARPPAEALNGAVGAPTRKPANGAVRQIQRLRIRPRENARDAGTRQNQRVPRQTPDPASLEERQKPREDLHEASRHPEVGGISAKKTASSTCVFWKRF